MSFQQLGKRSGHWERRFLWTIAILVMLLLVAALLYRLFAPTFLRWAFIPPTSFAESPQDPAPAYQKPENWLDPKPARWAPTGYAAAPKPAVAVFYVTPSAYFLRDRWNMRVQDPNAAPYLTRFLQTQVSIFNGIGEIWAPRYRQAAFGAFLTAPSDPNAQAALALAESDVLKAFDAFLAAQPQERPILLVGHSQGSRHLMAVLAKRIAGTEVQKRVVAAYLVGWPISLRADLPALGLLACAKGAQSGCILSWQSFAQPAEPDMLLQSFDASTGLTGAARAGTHMLCTNPLTGGDSAAATPSQNFGTLLPKNAATKSDYILERGLVGARCADRGLLLIDAQPEGLDQYILPGNNFHVYDYALFWANIRIDAEQRLNAWAALHMSKIP